MSSLSLSLLDKFHLWMTLQMPVWAVTFLSFTCFRDFFSINFIIEPCSLCSVSSFCFSFLSPFSVVLTLSFLRTSKEKCAFHDFHLRHVSVNFRCCEILSFFLPFGLSSTTHLYKFSLHLTTVFMACQMHVLT